MRSAVVHIGFHKTGTTSIQKFLDERRDLLLRSGIAFYRGKYIRDNHVELHLAAMRQERFSPIKISSGIKIDDAYVENLAKEIHAFAASSTAETLLFSAEGLSYLRYPDELDRLSKLIGAVEIKIVAYLREKNEWLRSYAAEMKKRFENENHTDSDACDYVGPGTWLLDYEARLEPFRIAFGRKSVITLDYDRCVAEAGNVIPSMLNVLELQSQFENVALQSYWENTRSG